MTDSAIDPQLSNVSTPNPPPTQSKPESDWTKVFLGPEGLRSGWGLLLYIAFFRLLISIAQVVLRPMMHRLAHTLWQELAGNVVVATCALLAAVIMSRIEKRPFGAYGLPKRGAFGKTFFLGLVWGFAALSLLLLSLRGLHVFYFGSLAEHGTRALKFALFWGVVFLMVGVVEEFLLRGYAQFTLARGIGFWPAAVLLSILFAAAHLRNPGENRLGLAAIILIGLFWCFTLARTGNLWFAVGLHAAWDWAESFFYGTPDSGSIAQGHLLNSSYRGPVWLSGGTDGPEGSLMVYVLVVLMFVVFHFAFPARGAELVSPERDLQDAT